MAFKFIPNTNTEHTAADTDTLETIDLGATFKGQTVAGSFQLGNTGSSDTIFTLEVSGLESTVRENVSYSLDGNTWESSVVISGVKPNEVTDLIRVRYTPDADDFTSSGTFLISVAES